MSSNPNPSERPTPPPRDSTGTPLQPIVLEKFRRALGEPNRKEGEERHWSLRRLSYISAVNILLDGKSEFPVVWVFDPHDPSNGVSSQVIRHESEVDAILQGISDRVKRAGNPINK